jgi:hypothetical protein
MELMDEAATARHWRKKVTLSIFNIRYGRYGYDWSRLRLID